jgi:hypothetical protein
LAIFADDYLEGTTGLEEDGQFKTATLTQSLREYYRLAGRGVAEFGYSNS